MPLTSLATIPSPGSNAIGLGPLDLRMYGFMIALGVIAAVWLARRRWAERGGDPEDMTSIALWAVPAGLVGARLYHVATDWKRYFPDRPIESLYIWQGGLGIPGGVALGLVVGVVVARKMGIRLPVGLDAVAPAVPLAQAIGRVGNWWNQELFGGPTDLPWALEVSDRTAADAGYAAGTTFHPTFLYESLWNLAVVVLLIWIDRKRVLRPGNVFVLYVACYLLGRLWVEALRVDPASLVLGVRINIWMSVLGMAAMAVVLAVRGVRRRPGDDDEPYDDGHRFEPAMVGAATTTTAVGDDGTPDPGPGGAVDAGDDGPDGPAAGDGDDVDGNADELDGPADDADGDADDGPDGGGRVSG